MSSTTVTFTGVSVPQLAIVELPAPGQETRWRAPVNGTKTRASSPSATRSPVAYSSWTPEPKCPWFLFTHTTLLAFPMTGITAEECAWTFTLGWVARFGVPLDITSNRGRQFTSAISTHFSHTLGSKIHRTTSYHPQSNGPNLQRAMHVFVCIDASHPTCNPPYAGPFRILERDSKNFTIELPGRSEVISTDHIKPAVLPHEDSAISTHCGRIVCCPRRFLSEGRE